MLIVGTRCKVKGNGVGGGDRQHVANLASKMHQRVEWLKESSDNMMGFMHSHFIQQTIH